MWEFFRTVRIIINKKNISYIKENKESYSEFKKYVLKETELRGYIYELNESYFKLYDYFLYENEFFIVNESYDCNLNDLLFVKNFIFKRNKDYFQTNKFFFIPSNS